MDDDEDEFDAWGFEKQTATKKTSTTKMSQPVNPKPIPSLTLESGQMFGGKSLLVNAGIGRGRGRGLLMSLQNSPKVDFGNSVHMANNSIKDVQIGKVNSPKTDLSPDNVNSLPSAGGKVFKKEHKMTTVSSDVLSKPAYGNFDDAECFYDEFDDEDDNFFIGGMTAKDFVGSRSPKEATLSSLNKQGGKKTAAVQQSQPSAMTTEPDAMLAELIAAHPDIPRAMLERMVAVHRDKSYENNREKDAGQYRQCLEVSF